MHPQLRELAARILHLSPEAITPALSMENCVQWTSLAHVELIASLEDTFKIVLDEDDIFELLDLASVDAFVNRRLSNGAD